MNQRFNNKKKIQVSITFSESVSEYTRPGRYSGGKYALAVSGGASCNVTLPRDVNSRVCGVTTGPTPEPPTTPPSATNGTVRFNYETTVHPFFSLIIILQSILSQSSWYIETLRTA